MVQEDENTPDASFAHCFVARTRSEDLWDDIKVPETLSEAWRHPGWAEAIERNYNAFVQRRTLRLVYQESGVETVPFLSRFFSKLLITDLQEVLPKSRCKVRGDLKLLHLGFCPETLYVPVAPLETIRLLFAMAAKGIILGTMDISDVNLYWALVEQLIME